MAELRPATWQPAWTEERSQLPFGRPYLPLGCQLLSLLFILTDPLSPCAHFSSHSCFGSGSFFPCSRKEAEIASFPASLHCCELLDNSCIWLTAKLVLSSIVIAFSSLAHPLACLCCFTNSAVSLGLQARSELLSNPGWAGFYKEVLTKDWCLGLCAGAL